jgi:outer membrane protein TolC
LDQLTDTVSGRLDVARARHTVLQAEMAGQAAIRQAGPSGSLTVSANAAGDDQSFGISASIDSRSYQPAVALSFDPGIGFGSGPGSVNRQDPSGLSVAARVSVPLDGRASAARAAADRNLEQARLQLELAEQHAWVELNNRGYEHESADTAALLSLQVLQARQVALETAELRLELGLITELDLLQSRHGVAEAELALARANDALLLVTLQLWQGLTLDPLDCLAESLPNIASADSGNPAPGGNNEMS